MKGGFSLRTKKGSILYITLVLIFSANLALRNFRLLGSHSYLERGIYSLDERMMEFNAVLDEVEVIFGEKFMDFESAKSFFSTKKIFYYNNFSISGQVVYNESVLLNVKDEYQHLIEVELFYLDGAFILKTRGV